MKEAASGKDIEITKDGDLRTFTVAGVTWKIRVRLTPQSVTLCDAETGAVYCEQSLDDIGIAYRKGKYIPSGRMQHRILNAFTVAWVLLRERH